MKRRACLPPASKIRRFFNLSKDDDVRKFVIRREVTQKNGKTTTKAPKIQRLVTPIRLQRKRHLRSLQKRRTEAQKETISDYKAALAKHAEERKVHNSAIRAQKKARRLVISHTPFATIVLSLAIERIMLTRQNCAVRWAIVCIIGGS